MQHNYVSSSPRSNVRPYGIDAETQTGISRSLENNSMESIVEKRLSSNKQVDYVRQRLTAILMSSLSDINARIIKNIFAATIQSRLGYGTVTFGLMASSNLDRIGLT